MPGRAVDITELEQVARWATSDLRPHVTVVLDVDPRPVSGAPATSTASRWSRSSSTSGSASTSSRSPRPTPTHYLVLPADGDAEKLHDAVRAAVEPWLGQACSDMTVWDELVGQEPVVATLREAVDAAVRRRWRVRRSRP